MRKLLRSPLVAFLLVGALLFALDRWRQGRAAGAEVVVEAAEIARLEELWRMQAGREPTAAEREAMIHNLVREEILYREARRLGLDRDDTIVRRRLAQKMEFLLQDLATVSEPTEEELRAHHRRHADRYIEPARLSFRHVFLSRERHGDDAAQAARELLPELRRSGAESERWRRVGDPFMLQREYGHRTRDDLAELFGGAFAEAVSELPVETWGGPVDSAYGAHLVWISQREAERPLTFDEARDWIADELRFERRTAANRDAFEEIAARYEVRIEAGDSAQRLAEAETEADGSDS